MIQLFAALALVAPGTSSEVTIYNQGFGFVKEIRQLSLKVGQQTVAVDDVAAMIQPSTVAIRSLTDPDSLSVLEQNYEYDLISPIAILNKSVGQPVRLVRHFGGQTEVLEGVLLSAPTAMVGTPDGTTQYSYNGMVIKTADGRIILSPTGEVEVLKMPAGLISKPTLVWDLDSAKQGSNTIELSYVTNGLRWNADYVMTLDGAGKADLKGWVTVDNQSGASFENAKMKLLAGDVNQIPASGAVGGASRMELAKAIRSAPFNEESLFEYHLYTLARPTTILDKQTKQISLLEGHDIPTEKKLILDATRSMGRYYPGEGEVGTGSISPQVRIEFVNDKKSGLGMPLPAGAFRIYQRDESGSTQMLGSDSIEHTPRDEKVSLVVGRSFDVVGERKRMNFRWITPGRSTEETYEIDVRNHKDTAQKVYVIERSWGDWKISQNSQAYTKLDANTFQFVVDVPPNQSKKVTYTIQTSW